MFLDKKYVLANELIEKMGINIANISTYYGQLKHLNNCPIIKLNSVSFINKNSGLLPNKMKKTLEENKFTDMSNKLPCVYVNDYYGLSKVELEKSGIIIEEVEILEKRFYIFTEEFVKKLKNKVPYVLNEEETISCYKRRQIDGYIELKTNKFLTWY
jgi:hypothetical protein